MSRAFLEYGWMSSIMYPHKITMQTLSVKQRKIQQVIRQKQ
jgi:hypothetical protein